MDREQMEELLLQALETEIGGIQVYETALRCVEESELRDEWEKYLDETREHEHILREVLDHFGIDAERQTPGRAIVHHLGQSLVQAMEDAVESGRPGEAQLVATECVTLAETKDHLNWELIGELAQVLPREEAQTLKQAHRQVEDQEDEHLYHTMGWSRELWLRSLGLEAILPPPEEQKDVRSQAAAGRARQQRTQMLRSR